MCGIFAWIARQQGVAVDINRAAACSKRQCSRGPDNSGLKHGSGDVCTWALAHERLSIMDPIASADQPMAFPEDPLLKGLTLVHNGEIYNHQELYAQMKEEGHNVTPHTGCDSEVILHLYAVYGLRKTCELMRGMFGFVIVDEREGGELPKFVAARDHVGIKPLYMAKDSKQMLFASELKCVHDMVDAETGMKQLCPPGCFFDSTQADQGFQRFWQPDWMSPSFNKSLSADVRPSQSDLRAALKEAVRKRMMSDVPYGALLSGGVDSCIVTSLMLEIAEEHKVDYNWPDGKLRTFTVGMQGSPDIMAARAMSRQLGSTHHERLFTADEACSIVPDVIKHLETFEPELIRSAIPNYFLAQMTSQHVKMVITGEGADELFAGYLYFRDAPDADSLQNETVRIFQHLQNVNLQRADRMTMAHSLEARVPFLDIDFAHVAFSVDPDNKRIVEGDPMRSETKQYLREIFAAEESKCTHGSGLIPRPLLFRKKAMQCEGVGTNWVNTLQEYAEQQVSEEEYQNMKAKYANDRPPHSREEAWYRRLFEENFPGCSQFVHVWEGGCRAGGASWQSAAYTRHGLADPEQLKHQYMDDESLH